MRSFPGSSWAILGMAMLVAACATAESPARSTPTPAASSAAIATSTPDLALAPTPGRIGAGYRHTCALTGDDAVRCWGSNSSGQLGNETTADSAVPVDVAGLASGVGAIAVGAFHACALTSAGGVQCWGSNESGQLGDGTTADSSVPVDVSGLTRGVSAISAGWSSTCALTTAGGVKCWGGNNRFGVLADGTMADIRLPVDVSGLGSGVRAIATGGFHACALTSAGSVMCWGEGQSDDPETFTTSIPVGVPGLASGVVAIGATMGRSCALEDEGGIVCWGPNYAPPAGESLPDRFVPVDVSGLDGEVTAVAVGETHGCVLTTVGRVACWGNVGYGQLGPGALSDGWVATPVDVPDLGTAATAIAVGGTHSCVLLGGGGARCWGNNGSGQLGSVTRCSSTSLPIEVQLEPDAPAPAPTLAPTGPPSGRIEHATGPADVVLRYDVGPNVGVSELGGVQFNPGPEFTLYGDGTVIFRLRGGPPPTDRPIVRGNPFTTVHLDDEQMQALLRFALGEGGLIAACERYEAVDTDVSEFHAITIRAGGLVKRVSLGGPSPVDRLAAQLLEFDPPIGTATSVFVADRYWGSILDAASAIELGLLPDPGDDVTPWPWPNVVPEDFVGRDEGGWIGDPRRVLEPDESAVLGLDDDGGVVAGVFLSAPDGATIYNFSMWPLLPDDPG